ncbi:MAG: inorganic phosphate transporter [Chloroflexi bacterium]|nr:inorganic phosphate transporter [Chloroflexota bacterium]
MDTALVLLIVVLVLGLVFEFVNGFHDAANAIATVVATRVLPPLTAVLMAGVLNFLGAISGTAVATTVGKGLVDPLAVTQVTVATGLLAAILWDLATWYVALPTSSSHALVFGVLGAGVATNGFGVVQLGGLEKVSLGIIYSPIVAFVSATALMILLYWLAYRLRRETVRAVFGRLQLLSSAYMAFSHGSNDGQKTMGIIALALFTYGALGSTFYIPLWVMVAAAVAIALGTAVGGWRIIRTMGYRLAKLEPIHGFAAETAAGTVIEVATRFGMPISTTHAINGAILGVGSARGLRGVRWGMAGSIVTAWVLTIPGCFILGWLLMQLMMALGLAA